MAADVDEKIDVGGGKLRCGSLPGDNLQENFGSYFYIFQGNKIRSRLECVYFIRKNGVTHQAFEKKFPWSGRDRHHIAMR